MSRRQAGFLIGFLVAVVLWAAGFWVTLGAVVAGAIGYAVVRVVDGEVDLGELTERVTGGRPQREPR